MRLLIVFFIFVCGSAFAQTTFILVRHAEKEASPADPKNPLLSKEGQGRAQALMHLLETQKIDMIMSTDFNRTKQTVEPTATAKSINIQTYQSLKEPDLTKLLNDGTTILICGHSNTIPALANLLTGKDQFKNYDDSDYGNILIVSVTSVGHGNVTHLRY